MKILVFGAGAVGGYFGGMMATSGLDVGFIVRGVRARALREHGLVIKSPDGETRVENPVVHVAGDKLPDADILLLAVKATGLEDAIASLKGAVSDKTLIVPLLNGLRHVDALAKALGDDRIAGGLCYIQGSVDDGGAIRRHNEIQKLVVGARHAGQASHLKDFIQRAGVTGFAADYSDNIGQAMWNKIVFLATLAGATCLARGTVGEIVAAPYGADVTRSLFDECLNVARAEGFPLSTEAVANGEKMLLAKGSGLSSSMLGDVRAGNLTEGDHILGDLIARAERREIPAPLLKAAHTAVLVHEGQIRKGQSRHNPAAPQI